MPGTLAPACTPRLAGGSLPSTTRGKWGSAGTVLPLERPGIDQAATASSQR